MTTGFIRIFTKIPGRKADLEEPYIVKSGITVFEMAQVIHRDIADNFQFARVWGKSAFNGQKVGKEHILCDGDIIEIH
jgi:ribosome-interacting GTPase 1